VNAWNAKQKASFEFRFHLANWISLKKNMFKNGCTSDACKLQCLVQPLKPNLEYFFVLLKLIQSICNGTFGEAFLVFVGDLFHALQTIHRLLQLRQPEKNEKTRSWLLTSKSRMSKQSHCSGYTSERPPSPMEFFKDTDFFVEKKQRDCESDKPGVSKHFCSRAA